MIPEGNYKVKAVTVELIESPEKKTPGFTMSLRVEEGEHKGQLLDHTVWISEKTRERAVETLTAMGFDGTDPTTCCKNEMVAVVENEDWTGKDGKVRTAPRVKWLNDPNRGGAKFTAMDPGRKASLLGELRGLVLSHAKKTDTFEFGANKPKF